MSTVWFKRCEQLPSTRLIPSEQRWSLPISSRCKLVRSSNLFSVARPVFPFLTLVIVIQSGKVSSPADLRYRENLLFPNRLIEEAGNVEVGQPIRKAIKKPQKLKELREAFPNEKFLINRRSEKTYMLLEQSATGEDALRGWLVAAFAAEMERSSGRGSGQAVYREAYEKMERVFPSFVAQVKAKGWYTDQFLHGSGIRFAFWIARPFF